MAKEKKAPEAEEAPKAKKTKAKKVKEEKVEAPIGSPIAHDYEVIGAPIITEKTMALLQNANKVTLKVNKDANKIEIAHSFERLYGVKALDVKIVNVSGKEKSRGGRYKGTIPGYKKAVVSIPKDAELDLFKE